jgi:hypothetical protein
MNCPVSASRMPLFWTGGVLRRTGTPAEFVTPAEAPALKIMLDSESRVAPAAFLTENVVKIVERAAPAPELES